VHFVGLLAEEIFHQEQAGSATTLALQGRGPSSSRPGTRATTITIAPGRQPFTRGRQALWTADGVSVYRDKITLRSSARGNEFREWISAAHIVWTKENPEFLAEFANVNHKNI